MGAMRKAVSCAALALVLAVGIVGGSATTADAAPFDDDRFIERVHSDFLGREASDAEMTWWLAVLQTNPRSAVVNGVLALDEFADAYTSATYYLALERVPSSSELTAWRPSVSGGDYIGLEVAVYSGSEFFTASGGTNTGFVTELYREIYQREPDSGGLTYWVGQLNTAAKTRGQVAKTFIRSSEGSTVRISGTTPTVCGDVNITTPDSVYEGAYCILLDRVADSSGAAYWIGQLQGTGNLPTVMASLATSTEYYETA